MAELLSGTDLCLLRGDRCLIDGLNFALNAGELLLVQGANGSGKTSLLRAIAGLAGLERGEVRWQGVPTDQVRQSFRADTVWLAHRVGFKGDLSLMENLRFEAGLRATAFAGIHQVLERLGLSRLADLPLRALSAGQQRRVALARMLMSDAQLWLMDEPFTNLDAGGQATGLELISGHLAGGGACVVAAHQAIRLDVPIQEVQLS